MSYNAEYFLTKFSKKSLTEDFRFNEATAEPICYYEDIGWHSTMNAECYMKLSLCANLGCAWIFIDKILRNRIKFDTIKFIDVDVLNKNKSDYYAIVYIDWS